MNTTHSFEPCGLIPLKLVNHLPEGDLQAFLMFSQHHAGVYYTSKSLEKCGPLHN